MWKNFCPSDEVLEIFTAEADESGCFDLELRNRTLSNHGVEFSEDDDQSLKSLSDTTNCEVFGLDDVYIDRRSQSFAAFSSSDHLRSEFSDIFETKENDFILKTDFQLTKQVFLKKILDMTDMDFLRYEDEKEINFQLLFCRELILESSRNEETLRSDLLFFQNENLRIENELRQQRTSQVMESQRIEAILRKELYDLQVETATISDKLHRLSQESQRVENILRKEIVALREENERLLMLSQHFRQCQSELFEKLRKCEEEKQHHIEQFKSSASIEEQNMKLKSMENLVNLLSQELEDMNRKYNQLSTLRTAEQITLNFIVNQNKVFPSSGYGSGHEIESESKREAASYPVHLVDSLLSQIQQRLDELCLLFPASPSETYTLNHPSASSQCWNDVNVPVHIIYPKLASLQAEVRHQMKTLSMEQPTNGKIPECQPERNLTCLQHGVTEASRAIRQLNFLLVSNGKGGHQYQSRIMELRHLLVESLQAIEALQC